MCRDAFAVDDFHNPETGFRIDNAEGYGLDHSMVAARLPMMDQYGQALFEDDVASVASGAGSDRQKRIEKRAMVLASCEGGESHDCFLCGVVVQFNITAPRYFWAEFGRYHFADIVSSTSTMHKLKAFVEKAVALQDEGKMNEYCKLASAHFSPYTHPAVINGFMALAGGWVKLDKVDIEVLKACLPEGWMQTARITTNYRQLKTMYRQRHNHRLQEWRDFCAWMETLPMASELILGKEDKGNE